MAAELAFTPYDWNRSIQNRDEYVRDRLRTGSPVAGLSYDSGVALVTVRGTQRKVFEVYDRLMLSALGNQADIEAVRIAAIDFAHLEGFRRSPDDVTIQRVVGFALSPSLKAAFGDPFRTPHIVRALFAELGPTPERDVFHILEHDGEFRSHTGAAAIGGTVEAGERMLEYLREHRGSDSLSLAQAVRLGLDAWAVGRMQLAGEAAEPSRQAIEQTLAEALEEGAPEVGILDRTTHRQSKFRLLSPEEIEELLGETQ